MEGEAPSRLGVVYHARRWVGLMSENRPRRGRAQNDEAGSRSADYTEERSTAKVRLIVWCKACGSEVEPDFGETARRYGAETTFQTGLLADLKSGNHRHCHVLDTRSCLAPLRRGFGTAGCAVRYR
jgi:hypothetical protein